MYYIINLAIYAILFPQFGIGQNGRGVSSEENREI